LTRLRRALLAAAGLVVAAGTLVSLARSPRLSESTPKPGPASPAQIAAAAFVHQAQAAEPPATAAPAPAPAPPPAVAEPPGEPADAHLVRSWRAPLAGGLLTFPPSFHSPDGRYDLIIHLNGNTDLVEESYGYAGVNAVVMILNLGVGSGVYEDRFADPASFTL